MKINNIEIANRWDVVMNDIGFEHLTIDVVKSEEEYYCIKEITIDWMLSALEYSLAYCKEKGNCRRVKRFIEKLNKMDGDFVVVEW